jgi:hypothetical protein
VHERAAALLVRLAAAASALCALVYLFGGRAITLDELEYFRATDWVAHGLVPYRDFFEHHLPLQWYLFAPPAALVRSSGTAAIVAMRVLQLPLWAITLWALAVWTRRDGRHPATAIAALLTSALFVMPAVEYRVDTVSVCAVMLALVVSERRILAAGVLLALAVLANIRFAPIAAVVYVVLLLRDRKFIALTAGAAIPPALYAAYLWVTHSAAAFWTHIVTDNAAIDRLSRAHAQPTLGRIAAAILGSADLGTILLLAGGIAAAASARNWRTLSRVHIAAIVALANLLFVLRMPVQYFYHFELTLLLCAFLVAHLEHRIVTYTIAAAAAIALLFMLRVSFAPIRLQDEVMTDANAAAGPGEAVFDGSGYAFRRPPAYRYWFLPLGVRFLAKEHLIEPYTLTPPPAAVVFDPRLFGWLADWPDLRRAIVRHYVPRWRKVWVPGGSGILAPGATATIELTRHGNYRVIAAPELLRHPWFRNAVATAAIGGDLTIDVNAVRSAPVVVTRRGALLDITSRANVPVGFFVLPANAPRLFEGSGEPIADPLFTLR